MLYGNISCIDHVVIITYSTHCGRCPVVNNFRAKDVALGGQGAPLVSLGEAYLFSGYDILLNFGGIANVSVIGAAGPSASGCVAFDVCPCNMLLNYLAQRLPADGVGGEGASFDDGGAVAATGVVIDGVLRCLNELSYYSRPPPKSLGREWFEEHVLPIVDVKVIAALWWLKKGKGMVLDIAPLNDAQ